MLLYMMRGPVLGPQAWDGGVSTMDEKVHCELVNCEGLAHPQLGAGPEELPGPGFLLQRVYEGDLLHSCTPAKREAFLRTGECLAAFSLREIAYLIGRE